jgi:hypothetical protein
MVLLSRVGFSAELARSVPAAGGPRLLPFRLPFSSKQLRMFFRLMVESIAYQFLEEATSQFASGEENEQQSDDEVVLAALTNITDEKLVSFALRVVLADHVDIALSSRSTVCTTEWGLAAVTRPSSGIFLLTNSTTTTL